MLLHLTLIDTLNYNLRSSGLLSAAPYLTMSILLPVAGYLADWLENKRILSTTQVGIVAFESNRTKILKFIFTKIRFEDTLTVVP